MNYVAIRGFVLTVKPQMDAYSFSVDYDSDKYVYLSGADSSCVLHAVYTFLEDIGYCFDITGPLFSESSPVFCVKSESRTIYPKVRERGIRQHINFPMDMSSYSLNEAKEYIRNLARMRFNHITFHSYPNQWIPVPERNYFAGHFFYGVRHDIPSKEVVAENIENEKTFCIPEIESSYDDIAIRSELAVNWLREVMLESKRVGMQIQFSFEPRSGSVDIVPTLQTVDSIMDSYPMIDILEVMTQEFNRDYATVTANDILNIENEHFGKNVLSDDVFAVNGVKLLVGEVCHNIKVIEALESSDDSKLPKIALGIYCVMPEYFDVSLSLVQEYLSEQSRFAFLAGHSSPLTLENMKSIDMDHKLDTDLWSRTMVYNWIEFDGLMYLQQNSIKGIYEMIKWLPADDNGQLCSGLSFNHWRTAENRTVARYASLACLYGSIEPYDFYKKYAEILGIDEIGAYIKAMTYLDNITIKTTTDAINIGFCFVGCWLREGLGWIEDLWKFGPVREVRKGYDYVALLLKKCISSEIKEEAADYLSFIDNRVRCTIIHLKAMEKAP